MKTNYERVDAAITKKDGSVMHYNVLEMAIKIAEEERIETPQELLDVFYEVVDKSERDSWDYENIELESVWGDKKVTATIYG